MAPKAGSKVTLRGDRTKFQKKKTQAQMDYLKRQSKDPYTDMAGARGFRSRAAFKLLELDERFKLLKKGDKVVDLGAAPGGWCQVIAETLNNDCQIIASDLLEVDPLPQTTFIQGDFSDNEVWEQIQAEVGGKVNVVLSDMAPNTMGHAGTDHLRIMALVEMAADCAEHLLKPGGNFACKIFQGGEEKKFVDSLRPKYEKVQFAKPKSSRKDSKEIFVVALGFKGE